MKPWLAGFFSSEDTKLATEEGFPTFPLLLFLLFNKKIIICLFSILWCLKGSVKCCCLHEGEDEWIGGGRAGGVLPAFIGIFLAVLRGRSVLICFVLAEVVLVLVRGDSWEVLWRGRNLCSWWWWTSGDKPFPPIQSSQGGCSHPRFFSAGLKEGSGQGDGCLQTLGYSLGVASSSCSFPTLSYSFQYSILVHWNTEPKEVLLWYVSGKHTWTHCQLKDWQRSFCMVARKCWEFIAFYFLFSHKLNDISSRINSPTFLLISWSRPLRISSRVRQGIADGRSCVLWYCQSGALNETLFRNLWHCFF